MTNSSDPPAAGTLPASRLNWSRRLRLNLAARVALSLFALTLLISFIVIWQAEQDTRQLLFDLGRAQARVFMTGVEREIQLHAPTLDPRDLEKVIEFATGYETNNLDFRIEHIFILNREGQVLASNQPEHIGADLSRHTYVQQAIRENRVVIPGQGSPLFPDSQQPDMNLPTLDVVMPLHLDDPLVPAGSIELELDLSNSEHILRSRYWEDRRLLLGKLALLMAGFGFLSFVVLRRQVIERVTGMAAIAQAISQGNLQSRVHDTGSDEIGTLAQAFNAMTAGLEQTIADLKRTQIVTMTKLAELAEKRDPDTGAHLQRMPLYCRALAEALRRDSPYADQLDDAFVEELVESCPLHDIGKVGIPDSILTKPGPLSESEFDIMRRHPLIGADVLSGVDFLKMAREMAVAHHERFDGSGYPHGLVGEQIPLSARIVALADMYDALTSRRAYKEAYSHEQAFAIMKEPISHERASALLAQESGRHFDPEVMRAFLNSAELFRKIRDQFAD